MITLFDDRDLVSFGSYMISDQRKESIKNHPEITSNQERKELLKVVTPFDFNNWLTLKMKADEEAREAMYDIPEVELPEELEESEESEVPKKSKVVPLNPKV